MNSTIQIVKKIKEEIDDCEKRLTPFVFSFLIYSFLLFFPILIKDKLHLQIDLDIKTNILIFLYYSSFLIALIDSIFKYIRLIKKYKNVKNKKQYTKEQIYKILDQLSDEKLNEVSLGCKKTLFHCSYVSYIENFYIIKINKIIGINSDKINLIEMIDLTKKEKLILDTI